MSKRVEDRQLHAGDTELRENAAVHEFHERVDDALRMDDDLDAIVRQPEEEMRFDHLERLVGQRCAVDSDLTSHPPRRMSERVFERRSLELLRRPLAKRS